MKRHTSKIKTWQEAQERELGYWKKELNHYLRCARRNESLPVEIKREEKVFEIGCGLFGPIYYLPHKFKVGIDPLAGKPKICTNHDVQLIRAVGEYLPFRGKSFGLILCVNVLDHVCDPREVLTEACNALKEEGVLFLQVYVFSRFLLELFGQVLIRLDKTHPHHFYAEEVISMVSKKLLLQKSYIESMHVRFKWFLMGVKRRRPLHFLYHMLTVIAIKDRRFV